MSLEKNKNSFINKANNIHNNKYSYSDIEYVNAHKKIKIFCFKHGFFEQTPSNHIKGHGCQKCFGGIKLNLEEFIIKANLKHGNFYNYCKSIYRNNKEPLIIICKLHGEFTQIPADHLSGCGCPKCASDKIKNKKRIGLEEFIKKSNIKHNFKYDYSLIKNFLDTKNKIQIICNKHGIFEQRANAHLSGAKCPKCKNSIGEEKIMNFLEKNNIFFEYQKRFKECKFIRPLPFDFYIPEYNLCIEFDGLQHFKNNFFNKTDEQFIKNKLKDNIKNKFCSKNENPNLLRINYKQLKKIDQILTQVFFK